MNAKASQVTGVSKNVKAARHWPLWGEFIGDWWIQRASNAENVSICWRHHDDCTGPRFLRKISRISICGMANQLQTYKNEWKYDRLRNIDILWTVGHQRSCICRWEIVKSSNKIFLCIYKTHLSRGSNLIFFERSETISHLTGQLPIKFATSLPIAR